MPRPNTPADFWRYVDKTDTCWLFSKINNQGYGVFWIGCKPRAAHRFAYELLVGPIPDGLVIDHLCRVRNCVNVAHLEPVTSGENTRRSPVAPPAINGRLTHCTNGHELGGDNRFPSAARRGQRICRKCIEDQRRTPVACDVCGKTYRTDTLRRHQQTQHERTLCGIDTGAAA